MCRWNNQKNDLNFFHLKVDDLKTSCNFEKKVFGVYIMYKSLLDYVLRIEKKKASITVTAITALFRVLNFYFAIMRRKNMRLNRQCNYFFYYLVYCVMNVNTVFCYGSCVWISFISGWKYFILCSVELNIEVLKKVL